MSGHVFSWPPNLLLLNVWNNFDLQQMKTLDIFQALKLASNTFPETSKTSLSVS